MLSIITCSRSPAAFEALRANLQQAASGVDAELVFEQNAPSLAASYNRSIARAKGDRLLFLDEHAAFLSTDGLPHLLATLDEVPVVGIAGTTRLTHADWSAAGPPYLYGQYVERATPAPEPPPLPPLNVMVYGAPAPRILPAPPDAIVALDPACAAFHRDLIAGLRFDEAAFPASVLCVTEAAYRAHLAGHRLAVACDVPLFRNPLPPPSPAEIDAFHGKHRLPGTAALFAIARAAAANVDEAVRLMRPDFWL